MIYEEHFTSNSPRTLPCLGVPKKRLLFLKPLKSAYFDMLFKVKKTGTGFQ